MKEECEGCGYIADITISGVCQSCVDLTCDCGEDLTRINSVNGICINCL